MSRHDPTDPTPASAGTGAAAPPTAHPGRWRALGLLGVAQLMLILDVTVVAVALPSIGSDLGMDRAALTWVVSAYTLAFGGLMLVGGRAADLFGPRRLVSIGLTVFAVASLTAGLAQDGTAIVAARAAQGLGAALMSPAALSVVVRLFDGEERHKALGIWSSLGGVGAALGVLLGGVLTSGAGWEAVFLVNVPVAAVVLLALPRTLPELPGGGRGTLDLVGALLVTGSTAALVLAFIGAGDRGWLAPVTLLLVAGSLVGYALTWAWLRRAPQPLVPPRLLARREVVGGSVVLLVGTGLMVAVFFLGTFSLQSVEEHSALVTGLLFLPVALATMAGATVAGRLLGRLGARSLGVTGLGVAAAGLGLAATGGGTAVTVTAVSVASLGLGALFVVASATTLATVAPEEAGVASGVLSTFHELGASLGAAVVSGAAAAGIAEGSAAGLDRGYLVAAAVAAVTAVVVLWLLPAPAARTPRGPEGTPRRGRGVRAFVRHYLEMVVAMLVGMALLHPLWTVAVAGAGADSWVRRSDVESLVMATAMTVPMVLWMWRRGHRGAPLVEMAAAMYAGFVVLFPFVWTGRLDDDGLMTGGHVLMLLLMLGAMLARREEYVTGCHRPRAAVSA